jgi:polar amino acid transport system substrate-binding protein
MSAEVLARIKDPFFTTKRDSSGTGLGLSISDTIIRNHGGWLDFSSEPQKGTTATILLPRYSSDEVIGRMI